ncbi:L-ascorbate oxidase [Xylaria sp. CBS 124048]|nr:L-ascorbate oxidase [Xylaria sp. CBS 124048]
MPRPLRAFWLLFCTRLLQSCLAASVAVHDSSWKPEYAIYVSKENITVNCEQRLSVVLNGTFPGPSLYLKEGQTTWVRVYNRLSDLNLTMHWHGLTMRTAPFSDGVPQVSQWPIGPGQFFDYEIHPEVGDAGSYYYHSHVGFQAMTAHGTLFVEDAEASPYEWDVDVPMVLGDFYQKSDDEIQSDLLGTPFKWPGEPDCLLLNDRSGTSSFDDAPDDSCKPYIVDVDPGKTYRLRFVGGTTISFTQVGIEGHTNLTVISADGYYTKPVQVDHLQLGSGQRYDVLLKAKSQDELNAEGRTQYWIRYETRGRSPGLEGYALLQYNVSMSDSATKAKRGMGMGMGMGMGLGRFWFSHPGSPPAITQKAKQISAHKGGKGHAHPKRPGKNPKKSPVSLPPDGSLTDWLEDSLESLNSSAPFPTLSEVTRTVYITVEEKIINGTYTGGSITGSMIWVNNDLTWTDEEAADMKYKPYLISAYLTGRTPDYDYAVKHKGWDPGMRAFPAQVGEVLDIVWLSNSGPSGAFQYHPMHAHGEHYWDLGSGNGTYDAVVNEAKFQNYTPARRDTTMLYRYAEKGGDGVTAGWRAWRIRITEDNVGAWLMHCHILHHMIMGMQTAWVFGDAASMLREIPEPYISGYLEYGGSAYGNDSYDPLVLTYFDG